jgi:hypothetical protein
MTMLKPAQADSMRIEVGRYSGLPIQCLNDDKGRVPFQVKSHYSKSRSAEVEKDKEKML